MRTMTMRQLPYETILYLLLGNLPIVAKPVKILRIPLIVMLFIRGKHTASSMHIIFNNFVLSIAQARRIRQKQHL